jgi:hypothetical protein
MHCNLSNRTILFVYMFKYCFVNKKKMTFLRNSNYISVIPCLTRTNPKYTPLQPHF